MCEEETHMHGPSYVSVEESRVAEEEVQLSRVERLKGLFTDRAVDLSPVVNRQVEISSACACNSVCANCLGGGLITLVVAGISNRFRRDSTETET